MDLVRIKLEKVAGGKIENATFGNMDAPYMVHGIKGSDIKGGPGGTYRALLDCLNNVRPSCLILACICDVLQPSFHCWFSLGAPRLNLIQLAVDHASIFVLEKNHADPYMRWIQSICMWQSTILIVQTCLAHRARLSCGQRVRCC